MFWWLAACGGGGAERPAGLTVEEVRGHLPADLPDGSSWAEDLRAALVAAGEVPDVSAVCQVVAIVEQESTWQADPPVAGLGKVVTAQVDVRLAKLGPLEGAVRAQVLDVRGEGRASTFAERLGTVRTEREVDLLFQEIVDHQRSRAPALATAVELVFPTLEERLNPIETAGSMQVSVAWAQALGRAEELEPAEVRDLLYTREGGLRYGTARLFLHDAAYDAPLYRFADYNAGVYSSRNAAVQERLARLTGLEVDPDGDLLTWTDRGRPARTQDGQTMTAARAWRDARHPELDDDTLADDLAREKTAEFEETGTWRLLWADDTAALGHAPAYARVPDVALDSPKLSGAKTTAWFAKNVDRRYQDCLRRR
jgi:hypothetical protein